MASAVILLPSGPTVMKASSVVSFSIAATWSVLNGTIVTLSGSTPDSFRITTQQRHIDLRSADHADAVPREIIDALDLRFAFLLRALVWRRPQHDDVLAQDSDGFGTIRHFLIGARNREIALRARSASMLSTGPAVGTKISRIEFPSRVKFCASAWIRFWSSLPDGPTAIRSVVGRVIMR